MTIPLENGLLQIFDVDHGQCALLTVPGANGAHRILVDCGHATNFEGAAWYPGRHLASMGVKHIDMLVCTNYDEDHASGFPDFIQQGITVGCILGNPSVPPAAIAALKTEDGMGPGIQAVANVLAARSRNSIAERMPIIPGVLIGWSCNPYPAFDDENNLSLVLTLSIHGFKFMFPGDLEVAGFRNLFRTLPDFCRMMLEVDVLIASHHGRASGICPEMFDEYGCRPKLVVISDDFKQYDTQETTTYYASKTGGVESFRGGGRRRVLTTRADGEIRFSFRSGQCFVW